MSATVLGLGLFGLVFVFLVLWSRRDPMVRFYITHDLRDHPDNEPCQACNGRGWQPKNEGSGS